VGGGPGHAAAGDQLTEWSRGPVGCAGGGGDRSHTYLIIIIMDSLNIWKFSLHNIKNKWKNLENIIRLQCTTI